MQTTFEGKQEKMQSPKWKGGCHVGLVWDKAGLRFHKELGMGHLVFHP